MEIDLEKLFLLRLAIARHGEMDVAKWWNTQGILARRGATVLKRGFPNTHRFAQARIAFAVAASRSKEVFDPPNSVTLWQLPAELEDAFQDKWHDWLDDAETWTPAFEKIELHTGELEQLLVDLEAVTENTLTRAKSLKRSAENRAVLASTGDELNNDVLELLAAAHLRSESGELAVPYVRLTG